MKRKSDSLQDNNNNQSFQKKINPKKSKKLVNKLLRTATTPSSILAAFRQVYGPHVSANITIENDGKNLAPTSISNMILFCLEGSMKRNTPQWCNIANRPLIQNVAVVMIPSLDPRWLSESPSSFPFLTTLKSRSLRVVSIQSDAGANVAVIIVRIVFIGSFFFDCLFSNHSFRTNPNKITNCFQLFSLLQLYN